MHFMVRFLLHLTITRLQASLVFFSRVSNEFSVLLENTKQNFQGYLLSAVFFTFTGEELLPV
jgi:hypothetical protein